MADVGVGKGVVVHEYLKGDSTLIHQVLNEQWLPPTEFSNTTLRYFDIMPSDDYDRNTQVTVQGIPRKGYYGDVVQHYNRLDVAVLFPELAWQTPLPITLANVFPIIKNLTQLDMVIDDFVEFEQIIIADGDEVVINIAMNPKSLQWIGEFPIRVKYGPSWLNLMVGRPDVSSDALQHPAVKEDLFYGRMSGWGHDWSFHIDDIKPNKYGLMTGWSAVTSTASKLGLPSFSNKTVYDYATSQVPLSNPAFKRVIVMNDSGNNRVNGPMYFHYNPI